MIRCFLGRHKWSKWMEIADFGHYIRHCGRCPATHLRVGHEDR